MNKTPTTMEQQHEQTGLAPCPFCGSKPWHHLFGTTLVVGCSNKECVLHDNTLGKHIQFTEENWNRRAPLVSSPSTKSTDARENQNPVIEQTEDTKRLDWLERNAVQCGRPGVGKWLLREIPTNGEPIPLREAIDAAMKEQK